MAKKKPEKKPEGGLRYIGGGGFIPGVPARDLSAAEVEQYGAETLVRTGLYAEGSEPAPARRAQSDDD